MTRRPSADWVLAKRAFHLRLLPAYDNGKPVRVGSRAIELPIALVERAGTTVQKGELMARAWPDTTVDEAAVRVNIAALRKSIGDRRNGNRFIANISGRGYMFVAPTMRGDAERLRRALDWQIACRGRHHWREQARELIASSTDESNAALPSAAWYMTDQGVAARALLARILWLQGFLDQANRSAETAYARAAEAGIQIHRRHASPATRPQMPPHHASLTGLGPAIDSGAAQPDSRTVRKLAESWHIKRAAGEPRPLPLRSALQTHAS